MTARVTCDDFSRLQQTSVFSASDGASNVADGTYEVVVSEFGRKLYDSIEGSCGFV